MNVRSCLSLLGLVFVMVWPGFALAAISPIVFPVTLSEAVNVTGSPRILLDVGGTSRFAVYSAGSGTASLSFSYNPTIGDVDLDGISVSAATIDLNGGTIKDLAGNDLTPLTFTAPDTSGVKVNYPSLSMDFVYDADGRYTLNGTAYDTLPAFLTAAGGTFSRASIGTYYDSTGTLQTAASGQPRFDYDPVTHAAKGILIEESRTNIFQRSEEFENSYWSKGTNTSVSANSTTSPDGALGADYIYATSPSGTYPGYYKSVSTSPSTAYTITILAKANEWNTLVIQAFDNGSTYISGTNCTLTTTAFTRCSLSFTSGSSTSTEIRLLFSGAPVTWIGVKGFFSWGAQLEQGAFATSYIPTTTAAVTRAADVLTVPTGGWFSASQGTVSGTLDFIYPILTNKWQGIFSIDDGTFANSLRSWSDPSGAYYIQRQLSGAAIETSRAASFLVANNNYKYSYRYDSSAIKGAFDGHSLSSVALSGLPTVNTLRVGESTGLGKMNGHLSNFRYHPLRAADTQLQLLTQ